MLVCTVDSKRKGSNDSNGPKKKQRSSIQDLWQVTGVSSSHNLTKIASALPNELTSYTKQVAHFFLFVYERQMVWERRNNGEESYTESMALKNYYFCNNYRELDRGTNYFRAHVLKLWEKHTKDGPINHQMWLELVLWASVCYRLVNRISTFEAFASIPEASGCIPEACDWPIFRDFLNRYATSSGKNKVKVFTDAHQASGLRPYVESMSKLYNKGAQQIKKISRDILVCCRNKDVKGCFKAIQTIKGAGSFIAWQVVCDLMESQCLKPCTENDWTELGPGATVGINLIFGSAKRQNFTNLHLAMILQRIQDAVYENLGIEFPRWNGVPLTLKNIEHALCEYNKYTAIHAKLSTNRNVTGQRLKKSKTALDFDKACQNVKQCGNSDDILFCDKCLNGYCHDCVPLPCSAYWMCPRCTAFESISFEVETVNHAKMEEPILHGLADGTDPSRLLIPTVDPDSIVGMIFLLDVDGAMHRAEVKKRLEIAHGETEQYLVSLGDAKREEVMTYAALLDILEKQHAEEVYDPDCYWTFKSIANHRKNGNTWKVLVEWDDDSKTWEPLSLMGRQDPVTLAAYAKDRGLLKTSGWKGFKSHLT